MVRKCIVPNCKSADKTILCHRFPNNDETKYKWLEGLEIDAHKYTPTDLKKYVVCTLHFDKRDYKNPMSNGLNTTALPKLHGHEPRVKPDIENINSTSLYEFAILKEITTQHNNHKFEGNEQNDHNEYQESLSYADTLSIQNSENEKSISDSVMETSIIQCNETDITNYQYSTSEIDLMTNQTLFDEDQNIQDNQHQYDSDVEIIDYSETVENNCEIGQNEIDANETQIKRVLYSNEVNDLGVQANGGNLSETVSLISSIAEADEDQEIVQHLIEEKTFVDVACQSDPVEIFDINDIETEDKEYKNKSRKDLIELIKEQKRKILEVDKKLKEFQATHIKLVQSLDAFKCILTKDVEGDS